ncbi:MAG: FAD-binding oxidoreductase [Yoonia sp.]|nr:FAD-binding oxidoreductase [Yoonia sp.]
MPQNIVIVGGGIIGAMAAYHLTQRGAQVTVLDAGHARATDASFGWVNASFFADDAHFQLRAEGIAAYVRLANTLDVPVTTQGSLVWENEGPDFDSQVDKLNRLGADVQVIDRQAFAALEPAFGQPPERAMLFPSESAVDSAALVTSLMAAASAAGARMLSGVFVDGVTQSGDQVTGVTTAMGALPADQVIVASGVGTEVLLARLGLLLPMLKRPGLMMRTRPIAQTIGHILASPAQELRQLSNGAILAPVSAGHQADTSSEITTPPDVLADAAIIRLRTMLPDADLEWDHVMLADRPMPQDGLPAVGAMGPTGLYVATMHSGITLGAIMGELIATEILDGASNKSTDLLAPYRPQRFVQ